MPAILKPYKATVGTKVYYFLQRPSNYAGGLDTATGITDVEDTELDEPMTSVAALVSKGKLFRVVCNCSNGTSRRTRKLLVTRDKFAAALDDLIDETFPDGYKITSVRIPQKAQYF